jgi:uncharacterized protein YndB with AHSA1/START domain
VPTTRRSRTVAASPDEIWRVVADPHHLPRWWPRVTRVEAVDDDAFTLVLATDKGRGVRADYRLLESAPPRLRAWEQEIEGTPFERILSRARTEVALEPVADVTQVTITLRQSMRGFARLGGFLIRRAGRRQLDDALDGLEAIVVG